MLEALFGQEACGQGPEDDAHHGLGDEHGQGASHGDGSWEGLGYGAKHGHGLGHGRDQAEDHGFGGGCWDSDGSGCGHSHGHADGAGYGLGHGLEVPWQVARGLALAADLAQLPAWLWPADEAAARAVALDYARAHGLHTLASVLTEG